MMKVQNPTQFDVLGIGAGPFNLSVAALLAPVKDVTHQFFERQEKYNWHPGMLLPNSTVQNSFLKDLVSFADPISPYSFLSFLHAKKRLYEYINAGFRRMLRSEFNQYLQWVGSELASVKWGENITDINPAGDGFEVVSDKGVYSSRNIVLGVGPAPVIPEVARQFQARDVFHSSQYLHRKEELRGMDIAVIGGGQSGAEIVLDLLGCELPASIYWISARRGISPIDESHFANEWYTPAYVDYFWNLPAGKKKGLLAQHTLSSDGVSPETIEEIYQKLYKNRYLNGSEIRCSVMYSRQVEHIEEINHGYLLSMRNVDSSALESVKVQKIVLATGYRQESMPEMIGALAEHIECDENGLVINHDFSLQYNGTGKIYVVNAARETHGVADPNLSLNAWRGAAIVNSILNYPYYKIPQTDIFADVNTIGYLREVQVCG